MEWRNGKLSSIGEILDRNIILKGADVLTVKGFTQVPNHVLVSDRLSPGAKLTYAMLLKYVWEKDYCFPGQDRLSKEMGVTRQSANTYLQELQRQRRLRSVKTALSRETLPIGAACCEKTSPT